MAEFPESVVKVSIERQRGNQTTKRISLSESTKDVNFSQAVFPAEDPFVEFPGEHNETLLRLGW